MKLLNINGITYVKKWLGLYYVVEHEGSLVMLKVKKWKEPK